MKVGYKILRNLNLVDKATLIYTLFTFVFILGFTYKLENVFPHLIFRVGVILIISTFSYLQEKYHYPIIFTIRGFYPILLLSYWYSETAYLNNAIFSKFDPFISQLDQKIFGFQPSLEFSNAFPQPWVSELIHFGYFSYYFLTVLTCLLIYLYNKKYFNYTVFIVTTSFFVYYLIFILFPVEGPQFFFSADQVNVPMGFIFDKGVHLAQQMGEAPTGAFPSSHVGMSLIFLILLFKYYRKAFYITIPLTVILCFATVYIKAHYFIDVVAGFITAPIIYFISDRLYKIGSKKNSEIDTNQSTM